jgi:hypothetical protein
LERPEASRTLEPTSAVSVMQRTRSLGRNTLAVIDFEILWVVYRLLPPSLAMDKACRDNCTSVYSVDKYPALALFVLISVLPQNMTSSPSVYLVIKSSATLVPGCESSTPRRPYSRLADVGPNGMPEDSSEDNQNYRYTTVQVIRGGEHTKEKWNIKIEYSGDANDDVSIVDWAFNKTLAGSKIQEGVETHIATSHSRANTTVTHDELFNIISSTYMLHNGSKSVWYWWDILEITLQPLRSYGVQYPEWEKDRVEDLATREKQGLDMTRRSRGDLTDDEVHGAEERLEALGIAESKDIHNEEIIGVE